jgi:hypothetical protein
VLASCSRAAWPPERLMGRSNVDIIGGRTQHGRNMEGTHGSTAAQAHNSAQTARTRPLEISPTRPGAESTNWRWAVGAELSSSTQSDPARRAGQKRLSLGRRAHQIPTAASAMDPRGKSLTPVSGRASDDTCPPRTHARAWPIEGQVAARRKRTHTHAHAHTHTSVSLIMAIIRPWRGAARTA